MAEPRKITIKLRPVGAKPGVTLKKPVAPAAAEPTVAPAPVAEAPREPLAEAPAAPEATPTPAPAPEMPTPEVAPATPAVPTSEQAKRQTSRITLPAELTQQPMSAPAADTDATIKLKPISQVAAATTETPEAIQANKSKTARIALDSVLGGIQTNTPLSNTTQKTIRLKRSTSKPATAAAASAPMAAVESAADGSEEKTIKLKKPGGITLKKPTLKTAKPASAEPALDGELETLEPLDDNDLAPITPMMAAPVEEESKGAKIFSSIAIVAAVASILLTLVLCVKLQSQAASADGSEPTGNTLHSLPFERIFG